MTSLLLFALIFLLLIVPLFIGMIVLQIFLCKKENHALGLILPIISFVASLGCVLISMLMVGGGSLLSLLLWLLLSNIPTIVYLIIYLVHRGKKNGEQQKQLDRMNVQDLD